MSLLGLSALVLLLTASLCPVHCQRGIVTEVIPGDAIDNDGDGLVDEEYCYNGIDEDKDGRFNEDCAYIDICPLHGSSSGREYVAMFLDNQPDNSAYNPLQMFLGRVPSRQSGNSDANVNVVTPLLANSALPAKTDKRERLAAGERGTMIDLPYQLRVTGAESTKKGIYIRSSDTISVHGFNIEKYTGDAFLGLAANSLGRDYFGAAYVPSLLNTEIGIVGLYTNTTVNVSLIHDIGEPDTPRLMVFYNGVPYENGQSFLIKINPFEVVLIDSEFDMTGTRLTADLPFAVFSGNLRTWVRNDATEAFIQSRDHLVEQIPAVETWGKQFVTRNYPPHQMADICRILTGEDDNRIVIKISNSSGTFDTRFTLKRAGMYRDFWIEARHLASIDATKKTMVLHYTHSQRSADVPENQFTDPSLIYVPPVDQFDNDYMFGTANYYGTDGYAFTTYVLLTARQGDESSITLDGESLYNVNWRSISLDSGAVYVQGYVTADLGKHRIRSSLPFGAIQWSVADRSSFAMSLGIRFNQNCGKCMQVICGDSVDNDCDGRADEETCDGYDDDGDGLVDEDCRCQGRITQEYLHATTTPEPKTTTTTTKATTTTTQVFMAPFVPPGMCHHGVSRGDCDSVNIVFIIDASASVMDQTGRSNELFRGMSSFIQDTVNNWLPNSYSKFGILTYKNGYPEINRAPTDRRQVIANLVGRKVNAQTLGGSDTSDLATALRKTRTEFFSESDNTRKAVIVLAFSSYGRTMVAEIRNETSKLLRRAGADVFFVGLQRHRDNIARLAISPNNIFTDARFDSWSSLSSPDQSRLFSSIVSSCGKGFKSLKLCYNDAAALSCPTGSSISLLTANFGRMGYTGELSCGSGNPLNCEADAVACPYVDVYFSIADKCNGKETCYFAVNSTTFSRKMLFFPTSCNLEATYLDLNYICAETGSGFLPPCSFTPASRMLVSQRDMLLSSSSFASCLDCGKQLDPQRDGTCESAARSQCQPIMATFDSDAVQAWCPSLDMAHASYLQVDLGAPYVVLGILLQGRRRLTNQYVSEVSIQVSTSSSGFQRVVTSASTDRRTFAANKDSSDIAWIPFETNRTVARFVRIQVEEYADHPALHFEVVIHNKVRGCEAFRGFGTSLAGQRGGIGTQKTVNCEEGTWTNDNKRSYQTYCQDDGSWSVEIPCQ